MSTKRKLEEEAVESNQMQVESVPVKGNVGSDGIPLELLQVYYNNYFPFKEMAQWLSFGTFQSPDTFKNREFSMMLKGDIYMRFRSYGNFAEWKKEVVKNCPDKMDIGAMYNAAPNTRQAVSNFIPLQKELIFDIDMTDYDDIRKCCKGADICSKCWILMTAAIDVLKEAMPDFGFEQFLFIYSGRRGVHCWISDERARVLSDEARSSVVEYLSVVEAHSLKLKDRDRQHKSLIRAFSILEPYFSEFVKSQDLFAHPDLVSRILELIPEKFITSKSIEIALNSTSTNSVYKWDQLKRTIKTVADDREVRCLMDIVFTFVYPRLDVNVSKHMNHLLKSPFCAHPKTGRVCVPIDPMSATPFDPFTVPDVPSLISSSLGIEDPSWSPYIRYFREYISKMKDNSILQRQMIMGDGFVADDSF